MMSTKTNPGDVAPVVDTLHFLQDSLDCKQLGITVVNCNPRTDTRDNRAEEEST